MGCGGSKAAAATPLPQDEDAPDIEGIDVPDTEPGYPPPKPPTRRKKEVFKVEEYQAIDDRAHAASQEYTTTYDALIAYLTGDVTTEMQKLRAIFTWLGSQRIYDMTYRDVIDPHTPRGYMKLIKKKGGTYPIFFALLCRAAHIPCAVVRGKCKGVRYEVGDTDISDQNSSWNAAYVDNSWRIVHPYWAFTGITGYETGRWTMIEDRGQAIRERQEQAHGAQIYDCDEFFFVPDPDEFVYLCIATDKQWQLLKDPWDEEHFVTVPHFQTSYFSSDLTLVSEHLGLLRAIDGKKAISFQHSPKTNPPLSYKLFFDEDRSEESIPNDIQLDMYVLQNTQENVKTFISRFPVRGIYKMKINGNMCSFRIDCDTLGQNQNPFPIKPTIGFGYVKKTKDAGLIHPSNISGVVVMEHNGVKKFVFKSKKKLEFEVYLRHYLKAVLNLHQYVEVETKGDEVTITVTMPDDNVANNPEYALEINAKEIGSAEKFDNICNYFISADKKEWVLDIDKPKKPPGESDEMKKIRRRLIEATNRNDIEELDKAIREFTGAGLEDKSDLTRAREKLVQLRTAKLKGDEMAEIRKRMVTATADDDVDVLEKTVRNFLRADLSDQGDLTAARERLVELHTKRLKEAIQKRDVIYLFSAIRSAESSVVSNELIYSEIMKHATETLEQLKRLKKFLHKILELKPPTVSEIHSYQRPKPLIHDVMKATFIVLGEREKYLNSWDYVQALMRRLGQESLIRRIKQFDLIHLPVTSARRANNLLNKYKLMDVRQHSAGAGTFYVWSNNIIKEQRKENN